MKNFICILLGFIVILSAFVACSKPDSSKSDGTYVSSIKDNDEEITTNQTVGNLGDEKTESSTNVSKQISKSDKTTLKKNGSKKNKKGKQEHISAVTQTTRATTEKDVLIADKGTTRVVRTTVFVSTTEQTTSKKDSTEPSKTTTNHNLPPDWAD